MVVSGDSNIYLREPEEVLPRNSTGKVLKIELRELPAP